MITSSDETCNRIARDKEQILEAWLLSSKELIGAARETANQIVRDEFLTFLSHLAESLKNLGKPSEVQLRTLAREHGRERAVRTSYTLTEIIREYGLLRRTLIESLEASGSLNSEDRRHINREIDDAIEAACSQFALTQKSELNEVLRQLKVSNQSLDEFASATAHDLKSPLNSIAGFTAEIRDHFKASATMETEKWFDIVDRSVKRMAELVDSSLDFARLSSRADEFQNIELQDVVLAVVSDLNSEILNVGACIQFHCLPLVFGDELLLRRLFQNLISNALKFHESWPSVIQILALEKPDHWLISVTDNGIGFDMKNAELIFELHHKIDRSSVSGGAGLGLATCRRIVEAHGFRISAESSPGIGTVFTFGLPKVHTH